MYSFDIAQIVLADIHSSFSVSDFSTVDFFRDFQQLVLYIFHSSHDWFLIDFIQLVFSRFWLK